MTDAAPPPLRRARRARTFGIAVLIAAALVGLFLAGARFGVLLPQTRLLIEAGADGLKVGRFGRLKIEGLSGDIWRDVGVRKLTISDEKGVWLEADNVHMTWTYLQLLRRDFHASRIDIQAIKVLRRPTLTKKGEDTGLPVSFHIDRANARVELTPEFSYERGVYDVGLNLDVERNGDQRGQVRVASLLHAGDYLNVDYDVARKRPLMLRIDGEEAQGGALAGAIGLSAKQPFLVEVTAGGKLSEGQFTAFANSGAVQPLRLQGAWTKDGGDARGAMLLTASALTAPYAERFGPRASFVLAGRRAGVDLFAFDGRVASENLSVRATGLGDLGRRTLGPQGLAVTAETAGAVADHRRSGPGANTRRGPDRPGQGRLDLRGLGQRVEGERRRLRLGPGVRPPGDRRERRPVGHQDPALRRRRPRERLSRRPAGRGAQGEL